MTEFYGLAVLLIAGLCFMSLHVGMLLTLLVGFLQDPLRKTIADAPVYYSTLVILFAAVTFLGGMQSGAMRRFSEIAGWDTRLKAPVVLFVVWVIVQSFLTFVYTGSIFLAAIGLLVYLSPFPALLLGYSFASTPGRLREFFWLYVAASAAMVSGVYLSWLGLDWEILQSVGEPLIVYSLDTGEALDLPSGFLRTPEVAAWHAASGACIAMMLGLSSRRAGPGLASAALVFFFVGAVMLTGRRKFLLEIAMFLPVFWWLMWRFRMSTRRILYLLFALATAALVVVISGVVESNTREAFQAPVVRGEDRTDEIIQRLHNVTIGAVPYVIAVNGFFGSGAGTGSGGAQYYGGGDEIVGGAAEGGLGKIMAEIGVPGVLIFFWLVFRIVVQVWRMLGVAAKGSPEFAQLAMGLAAFLASNVFVFAGAHQVYSDPFILLILGAGIGFILASDRLVENRLARRGASVQELLRGGARGFHSSR